MRTGVLSDDYIMNNVCVEYRPVPLGKVGDILTPEMKPKHGLELRVPKYARPPPRPATFQAMSNSLSNQADPTNPLPFQQQLVKQYEQELGKEEAEETGTEAKTPEVNFTLFDRESYLTPERQSVGSRLSFSSRLPMGSPLRQEIEEGLEELKSLKEAATPVLRRSQRIQSINK